MMKKLIVLLACLGLVFQITSCTSKDSQADAEVSADMESADLEQLEGDEALEVAADDSLASDQLPEDALGETNAAVETTTTKETVTTTTETTVGDTQATTEVTDVATTTETLPADPFAQATEVTPPVADVPAADSFASTPSTTIVEPPVSESSSTTIVEPSEPPKKASAPLQKVATAPWQVGKVWYNTVYFARPGDSLSSISKMIYGKNKKSELIKGNPIFKSRDVRPGDKVYYNSPNRPDDAARMITYYEDNGIAPEVYVAKAGDNIKKVSKELLGHSNAWKEIWSSNSVDSKGEIAEGTELRYWRGGAVAAAAPQQPAAQEPTQQYQEVAGGGVPAAPAMPEAPSIPAPPTPEEQMAQQQAQMEVPPPPPMEEPMGEMAPPPPPPDMAQDQMAPPPPPVEAINPPAPQLAEETEEPTGMDSDTTMALGVVGLAAAGLAVLIVMRKKRKQKELEQQAVENTHVGT